MRLGREVLLPIQGPSDASGGCVISFETAFHEPVNVNLLTVLLSTCPPWPVDTTAVGTIGKHRPSVMLQDFVEDVAGFQLGYT